MSAGKCSISNKIQSYQVNNYSSKVSGTVNLQKNQKKSVRDTIAVGNTSGEAESVKLQISKEGMRLSEEQDVKSMDTIMDEFRKHQDSLLKEYQDQLESSDEEADAMEDMAKIMEIARRISNGDIVPAKDEKKLMEFNSDLYQAAKAAAVINEGKKHKVYDSVFDEEEKSEELEEVEESGDTNIETSSEVSVEASDTASVEVSK